MDLQLSLLTFGVYLITVLTQWEVGQWWKIFSAPLNSSTPCQLSVENAPPRPSWPKCIWFGGKYFFKFLVSQMCICMDWLEWTNKKSFRPGRLQSKWANKLCHKDQKVQTNCGGKVTNFTIWSSLRVSRFQDFLNLQKFVKVMNGQWLSVLNRAKLETEFWRLKQAEGKKITNVSSDNLSRKKSDT